MGNLKNIKIETSVGFMDFDGVPVCDDFDYKEFASSNGFNYLKIDSPENTEKYGGIGFVTYKNTSENSEVSWTDKQVLEIVFVNKLPIAYSIK